MSQNNQPFGRAADAYYRKSWYPFPVKGKHEAIPKGVTGLAGKDPSWQQVQDWISQRPFSNVAVRANGWISIDVDEGGEIALIHAQQELGQLPATWTSTSWGPDSPRRQHFYRVPVGFNARLSEGIFRNTFGDKVDIIHRGHRYALVAPSIHPTNGQPYAWYRPDGTPAGNILPKRTEDLAELPEGWLDFLRCVEDKMAGGFTPTAKPTTAIALTDNDDPWSDAPTDHGWSKTAAQAEIDRMLVRIRTVEANVNTSAGGAMREIGRFVPGILTQDQAVTLCTEALNENPWHSDTWNIDNGKGWTAHSLAATAVTRGMEEPREILPDNAAPTPQSADERYTDAFMAERLAREKLAGQYVYTSSLGWLRWDGARWAEVNEESVHEAVRQWTKAGYLAAVEEFRVKARAGEVEWSDMAEDRDIKGWVSTQNAGRISNLAKLARGIDLVNRNGGDFDTDPALLNTPNGVVDLRTGTLMPHDPSRLITKLAGAPFQPGAESPALKKALEALPEDAHEWLQLMLGEATTGNSGERMVLVTGGGRNGKTLLMGSVFRALGSYAAKVPNTLLMKTPQPGAATPEKMTLRGIRFAYIEETPEDGYLDANVVKGLLDAEVIEGRKLYKDIVTWTPSHSIFLNTNHPPSITDPGEGTWRRLTRIDFPYRYRKVGETLEGPQDRPGDPHLKRALTSAEGQAALVAWLVAGAVKYHAAGSVEEAGAAPESVLRSTDKWRGESDDILRFMDDVMDFDLEGWVSSVDLYNAFAAWQKSVGQRPASSKVFTHRMDSHSRLPKSVERVFWMKTRSGLSRPTTLDNGLVHPLPSRVKGWSGIKFKIDSEAFTPW